MIWNNRKAKQILGMYKQSSEICGIRGKDLAPPNSVGLEPQQRRARMDMGMGPGTGHGGRPVCGAIPRARACVTTPQTVPLKSGS